MKHREDRSFPVPPPDGASGQIPARAPGAGVPPPSGSDSNPSPASVRQINQLKATIAGLPDIRVEKVEDLREAVEDGTYYVESEKIAKRVVDEALQEAARRSGTQRG